MSAHAAPRPACTRPGCAGHIVDGYCDVCGMAPLDAPAPAVPVSAVPESAPVAATGGPVADGTPCTVAGCTGRILDGYCDVCGTPAAGTRGPVAPAPLVTRGGPPATVGDLEPVDVGTATTSTSASRIQSAAIGSRRAGATTATRRARSGSERMRAARLGAGLTVIPPAPVLDPVKAVLSDPSIPEDKRVCSNCGSPVGRSVDGRPGRSEGFCPKCGQAFSFTPKLHPGDLVNNQYKVAGAIAHGGLGWIYLAQDHNVSDRWVVLKGLLNSGDPDALAAAIAEQRFLAQVEHPLIVEIYNFVTCEAAGYIVMEWVGGRSLKEILQQRMRANGGLYDALPVDQALAYILEILPAFSYLHDLGLVYCDFKPDNLIQVGDAVKLIDMGGVRRIDDQTSAIFGTVGYQAPEVADVGPSVASDLYTIGRSLVVLCMEFRGYQNTYLHTLPSPATTPLFAEHDSLYYLIAKCCALDPADRFSNADELRTQLLGVLRETVAARTPGNALTSAASVVFEQPATSAAVLAWSQLPGLRPDPSDSQHAWLQTIPDGDPTARLQALAKAPEDTAEVLLARSHAALELGDVQGAQQAADALLNQDPWEWRALWMDGLVSLQQQAWKSATSAFSAVYQQVPGELAPKLALAVACEKDGLPEVAEGLYRTCAATDAAYAAPAAFGMARVRAARHDTPGAVAALDLVPTTSRGYPESRQLRADVLLSGAPSDLAVLDQALTSIGTVRMDPGDRNRYTIKILGAALDVVAQGGRKSHVRTIGGVKTDEVSLRNALEEAYRALARDAPELKTRITLVNQANAVRNRTLW